jgi:hypothetical protein
VAPRLLLLLLVLAGAARAAEGLPAWLAGAWESARGGRVVREEWMAPDGGLMLGVSRTVRDGRAVEHEFMRLALAEGGGLEFTALPGGRAGTTFRQVARDATSFVVENPAHDFPQRIGYGLRPDGTLLAWIEGRRGARMVRIEYPYRRAAGR